MRSRRMTYEEMMSLEPMSALGDRSRTPGEVAAIRDGASSLADYDARSVLEWVGGDLAVAARVAAGEPLTVYRATGADEGLIWPGAYVTTSREYAEQHGRTHLGDFKILKASAAASDLFPASGQREFFFAPADLRAWHRRHRPTSRHRRVP